MAVGFPTKANWAAGDVLTAAQMDDLAGTVNTLSNVPPRNGVLNSNMSVWQRGTSFALSTGTYTADRWQGYRSVAGSTVTRQATGDTTNLPNIQYCARVQRDSGNTSTAAINFAQSFETVNSIPFAGKTVTLSFYARAGSNYSATSNGLRVQLYAGTGTDQNVLTAGYTGSTLGIDQTPTLTTTWQRFSYSVAVGAAYTELGIIFVSTPTGTAGANDYFEITGVQLELGSTASTYYPNASTFQGELAACQRYYQRLTTSSVTGATPITGISYSTTGLQYNYPLNPPMRVLPTTLDYANIRGNDSGAAFTLGTITLDATNSSNTTAYLATTSTALTAYRYNFLQSNGTIGYVGFSAEL